ncbi:type II secretion system F family protein [Arthrobacter halodurans]|uniref:Type II secretion system F family protein n=1 Tax=Arthrobacter halodurans TaxID=516699 RepID=A0ABV4UNG9_9MICC
MSVVIVAAAAACAAAAAWLALPVGRGAVPVAERGPGGEATRVLGRLAARWREAQRRRQGPPELETHVRAIRQLSALLRSGRPPAEAWALLESTWKGKAAPARGRRAGQGVGRGARAAAGGAATGATADGSAGARDVTEACRAARMAHTVGAPPSAGLERHLRSCGPEYAGAWSRLVWCVRLSESTGAALSDLLDRLAGQLEAGEDRRRALDAALAGPRATQRILAWLPAVGLALAQLIGADPLAVLLWHPVGRLSLVAGAALWWANRVWGARMLAGAATGGPGP